MSKSSRTTYVTLDADRQIMSGGTFLLYGIILTNNTGIAKTITFRNAADTATLWVYMVDDGSTEEISIFTDGGAIMDTGLTVKSVSDANMHVTLFHGQVGG